MDKKKYDKRPQYTSDVAVWKFPNVDKPSTKFNPEGVFDVTERLTAAQSKAFEAKHAKELADAIEAGQQEYDKLPLKTRSKLKFAPTEQIGTPCYDEATGKPTGEVEYKFKRKASGKSKEDGKPWTITLPLFDAKGKPMKGVSVWGGSEGRVTYELVPYFIPGTGAAGVSLKLIAAQVTKLVTKGQRDATGFGFDAVEGGYEHSADDVAEEAPEAADTAGEPEDF